MKINMQKGIRKLHVLLLIAFLATFICVVTCPCIDFLTCFPRNKNAKKSGAVASNKKKFFGKVWWAKIKGFIFRKHKSKSAEISDGSEIDNDVNEIVSGGSKSADTPVESDNSSDESDSDDDVNLIAPVESDNSSDESDSDDDVNEIVSGGSESADNVNLIAPVEKKDFSGGSKSADNVNEIGSNDSDSDYSSNNDESAKLTYTINSPSWFRGHQREGVDWMRVKKSEIAHKQEREEELKQQKRKQQKEFSQQRQQLLKDMSKEAFTKKDEDEDADDSSEED